MLLWFPAKLVVSQIGNETNKGTIQPTRRLERISLLICSLRKPDLMQRLYNLIQAHRG